MLTFSVSILYQNCTIKKREISLFERLIDSIFKIFTFRKNRKNHFQINRSSFTFTLNQILYNDLFGTAKIYSNFDKAWSKSATKSSMCSIPTAIRNKSGVRP